MMSVCEVRNPPLSCVEQDTIDTTALRSVGLRTHISTFTQPPCCCISVFSGTTTTCWANLSATRLQYPLARNCDSVLRNRGGNIDDNGSQADLGASEGWYQR